MTVYYLGPEETFSHRTASRMAQPGETLTPCSTFREVFRRTAETPGNAAVVPFENTSQGPITEVMDLLAEHPSLIAVACTAIPVHQHLLTRDLTTPIRQILSKAEALAQCRTTLQQAYPGIPLVPVSSTAEAARRAQQDPSLAAVAGESTGKRYELALRRPDVQDVQGNTTRFFRLESRTHAARTAPLPPTHALLYASINDHPGSLMELLNPLRAMDLTFIQSRPIPGEKWKYAFFLELLIGASGCPLATILAKVQEVTREVRLLGSYTITSQPTVLDANNTTALSSLRAMIADIDASLIHAFAVRRKYHVNPMLYIHVEPITIAEIAHIFATGEAAEQSLALRRFYLTTVVPYLAEIEDNEEPRQAFHADTEAISALARRFRFATKVIARKRVELAPELRAAANTGDPAQVEHALLNQALEDRVLERARNGAVSEGFNETQVRNIVTLYHDYLLPISRLIQVHVILAQA